MGVSKGMHGVHVYIYIYISFRFVEVVNAPSDQTVQVTIIPIHTQRWHGIASGGAIMESMRM